MKLGVFDSGIGGEAVAQALRISFADAEIMTVNDREHMPYGDRTFDDITRLTDNAIQPLLAAACDVIVIACNSATSAAIETLREKYTAQQFIGLEPMVKPAVKLSKNGIVCVCATPATLHSKRYRNLKDRYAKDINVIEPDCSTWAKMVEDNAINERTIEQTILSACNQGADVIVLACTHYHWIRETIEKIAASRVTVIDPSDAIARRVRQLLEPR